jgi:hypothetical protein
MKNQRQFDTERQRRADKMDERLSDAIIIAILAFAVICFIFSFFNHG